MGNQGDTVTTRATEALTAAGAAYELHRVELTENERGIGDAVAFQLGVEPERIFRTWIAEADHDPVVAVVPADGQLDLTALASAVGAGSADLVNPAEAARLSGFRPRHLSPIGIRKQLPVVLDVSVLDYPTVFVSAGTSGWVIEVSADDLLHLTNGRSAPLTGHR